MKKIAVREISNNMRLTHHLDASNKSLGRLATAIVGFLRGKSSARFQFHIDRGDFVVVENIKNIKLSGKKSLQKKYFHFSGYPGGIRERKFSELFLKNPKEVLARAVYQMLPDTRHRKNIIKRLIIK